ncbi:hypothetical protein C8R44DRAFT_730765 [Mycena epipterygia]|nr:hypothetical protein C8R44DRAFT_730765 [Mycena epipterygia]
MFVEMQQYQLRHEGVLLIDHANARNDDVNIKPSDTQSRVHVVSQKRFLEHDDQWQRDIHRYQCVLIVDATNNFPRARFDLETLQSFRDPYGLADLQDPGANYVEDDEAEEEEDEDTTAGGGQKCKRGHLIQTRKKAQRASKEEEDKVHAHQIHVGTLCDLLEASSMREMQEDAPVLNNPQYVPKPHSPVSGGLGDVFINSGWHSRKALDNWDFQSSNVNLCRWEFFRLGKNMILSRRCCPVGLAWSFYHQLAQVYNLTDPRDLWQLLTLHSFAILYLALETGGYMPYDGSSYWGNNICVPQDRCIETEQAWRSAARLTAYIEARYTVVTTDDKYQTWGSIAEASLLSMAMCLLQYKDAWEQKIQLEGGKKGDVFTRKSLEQQMRCCLAAYTHLLSNPE